jgi:acetolactate synthase I/II/III large subunit
MPSEASDTTVADAIVAALRAHGVDRVFCVAGESFLPLLEALRADGGIDVVTCRHEGSAGFAAVADAKLTGRPGVCLVSRGPGATNAAIAVHAAAEDATPLLLVVGQVPLTLLDRPAFQGLDCAAMFGGLAKAVPVLTDPRSAAVVTSRALDLARSQTPGPVVLAVPEDVCAARTPHTAAPPPQPHAPGADTVAVRQAAGLLRTADRPLLLAGELLDSTGGRAAVRNAAERLGLPVVCANKQQHLADNRSSWYAGQLSNSTPARLRAALATADLVLAVGTRLDVVTTAGHRFPVPSQQLVHVHPDPQQAGAATRPTIALAADPVTFLTSLASAAALPAHDQHERRSAWTRQLNGLVTADAVWTPVHSADGIVFGEVVAALDRLTNGSATVIVDSGGFTSFVYRHFRFSGAGRLVGIASSAMGFAVPAAVAAALRTQQQPVIAVVGDGGFGMNGSELATAVERRLRLTVVIADNNSYGTIRNHQERVYPGSVVATDLVNPDFARLADAYGALGITATDPQDVEPALAKALGHPGVSVVHVRTSLQYFGAYRRLGEGAGR